jgi:alkylhydroperoxidase/carboxymuconolactone decarboxylase family protein YurZ
MDNLHDIFVSFKKEFPGVYEKHTALGKEVHENSGPLPETTRWLLKIVISAACDHKRALETHIRKAMAAGVAVAEIKHALLLLIPTTGFPPFMKAYAVLDGIGN